MPDLLCSRFRAPQYHRHGRGDRINGLAGNDRLNGGGGTDTLSGNGAEDRFGFRFGDSSPLAPDQITDYNSGLNRIVLTGTDGSSLIPSRLSRAADSAAATLSDLVASLFTDTDGAQQGNQPLGTQEAVLVKATNSSIAATYLLINDATPGLQNDRDLLIKLGGFSGTLPALGSVTPSLFFA